MDYRVSVCDAVPQAVLRLPREIRSNRLGEDVAAGMRELMATVQRAGLTASGPPTITFPEQSFADEVAVVDFGLPVEPAPTLSLRSGAEVIVLPRTLIARTAHRGGYAGLGDAYLALQEWMHDAGYRPVGPPTEAYLVGPDEVTDPHRLITEIRIPVAPAPAIAVHVGAPFAETLERTREALRQQGFGVLTEIDMQATLAARLGAEMEQYVVLGACHPPLAQRALGADRQAGLLLPCNVVVRAVDDGTLVEAVDPGLLVRGTGQDALQPIAEDTRRLLTAAIDALRAPVAKAQHGR
jgi:uncharacterized protein (DUF302 family)/effector-binding domain-containing protein